MKGIPPGWWKRRHKNWRVSLDKRWQSGFHIHKLVPSGRIHSVQVSPKWGKVAPVPRNVDTFLYNARAPSSKRETPCCSAASRIPDSHKTTQGVGWTGKGHLKKNTLKSAKNTLNLPKNHSFFLASQDALEVMYVSEWVSESVSDCSPTWLMWLWWVMIPTVSPISLH